MLSSGEEMDDLDDWAAVELRREDVGASMF